MMEKIIFLNFYTLMFIWKVKKVKTVYCKKKQLNIDLYYGLKVVPPIPATTNLQP